jgi:excinuclease ABC subunit C
MTLRKPHDVPAVPGSYQFIDAAGRVIYVGKAANLRNRVANYFADPATLHPRIASMVAAAQRVEWITVDTEVEALMLEYNLIKRHRPRFNVRLRDDKSYPYLAVTLDDPWPRAGVMRGRQRKGTKYFGPYAQAWAIRDSLDAVLRQFPVRTCSDTKFRQHERLGRPCLLFHIEKCAGPCIAAVDAETYARHVDGLVDFLSGDVEPVVEALTSKMESAARDLDFETAATCRDRLGAIDRVLERQLMVGDADENFDVLAVVTEDGAAGYNVFHVRKGRVLGRIESTVDNVEELGVDELTQRIIEQTYAEEPALGWPRSIHVDVEPSGLEALTTWLSELRGSAVTVHVPQRGAKRDLLDMARRNAHELIVRERSRRAADHNARSKALNELRDTLGLPEAPLRIECYDMAHLHGTDYVGSMVVLEDGLPSKKEYRTFNVKTVDGNDDYAAMAEVLRRRLAAYVAERDAPTPGTRKGFSYPPGLLLVDGGKGQLVVAVRVLDEFGLRDTVPVAALAKRLEEVFVPGRETPVHFVRGSEALFMLQTARNEAHRVANSFHRRRRSRRMSASDLDGIQGLGPQRRQRLLDELGGVAGVKSASRSQLARLTWLPADVADRVAETFALPQ